MSSSTDNSTGYDPLDRILLVDAAAHECGLTPRQLSSLIQRGCFPRHDGYFGARRFWRLRTVIEGREALISQEGSWSPPPRKRKAQEVQA